MTTLQEQIAVMQHFANGGKVECKSTQGTIWSKTTTPMWNWIGSDYRIAQPPKQKMWQWIVETDQEPNHYLTNYFYKTKEEAQFLHKPHTVIKPALWTEIEL